MKNMIPHLFFKKMVDIKLLTQFSPFNFLLIPKIEPKIKMWEEIMTKYKKNYKLQADGEYGYLGKFF